MSRARAPARGRNVGGAGIGGCNYRDDAWPGGDLDSLTDPFVPTPETAMTGGGRLVTALVAPLRLPARVVELAEMAADALADVGAIRTEVVRIRRQSESLDELLPALNSLKQDLGGRLDSLHEIVNGLEGIESDLDTTVAGLVGQLTALHQTVASLQDDVQRITHRLPDPDEPGPLERARDALTGGGEK